MESVAATQSAQPAAGNGAAGDGATIEVHRPADGTLIRSIPVDSPERVAEVVGRVRANQAEWEAIGFPGRRRWLERLRDWMIDNEPRLADVMQEETGKVRAEAESEAPLISAAINYYSKHGEEFLADETPAPNILPLRVKRLRIVYRPYPVVGVITPWNFPLLLAFDDAVGALFAGCAVVIKPSEFTPFSIMEAVRGWKEDIGGPDVLDVVNGLGDTGGRLIDEVDFVQFTGSDRTGRVVMKRAAETLTPVSLELGGKDPLIVLRDADLERAVNATAMGGLLNSGQACTSIERVYVEEPVYDEFVARLGDRVRELRQGQDGRSYGAEIGAMATPAQVDIVSAHVEDARQKGASIVTGGKRREGPGQWYEPTVIADVDHSMKVMTEETFGPVLPVMKVRDADQAVRLANDTRHGLSASVFAGTSDEGASIARRIEAGAVNVNDVLTNYFALGLPMGGWKESGIGFRHGSYGIKKFVRPSSVIVPRVKQGKRDPLWFPYTGTRRRLVNRVNRLINARGLRNRLGL
jgi:acyl-CoA reductase-like NAD-dependent aldehyde dehydrogenase